MRVSYFSLLFFLGVALSAQAPSPYGFLSSSELSTLDQGDPLYFTQQQGSSALYYPRSSRADLLLEELKSAQQDVITEVLFYQHYDWADHEVDMLNLANRFLQISQQEGILYFSHRKQEWVELIEESYTLESPNSRDRAQDHILSSLPQEMEFWCFQRDAIFGGNSFRYNIDASREGITISFRNQTPMRVMGILTAFDEEELNIRFFLTPSDEGFHCYAVAYIENLRPMVERRVDIGSAFRKRIEAVLRWYMEELP